MPRKAKTLDDYIELASGEQKYCMSCQPYDTGECVWILGDRCSMDELLDSLGIPQRFRERVANAMSCRSCGADLDITSDVGTATESEKEEEALWEKWHEIYSPRFDDFSKHLESFPYLGLFHPIGTQILKEIKNLSKEPLERERWYRARKVEDSRILANSDLYPPDPVAVAIPEGRYNHFGQQVFYLSDTRDNAAREILGKAGGLAWVQEFELKPFSGIANLCQNYSIDTELSELLFGLVMYSNILSHPVERAIGWKPEYFVPRFIADCLKHEGFTGILFRSPHHYGDNLVLFKYNGDQVRHIGDPTLITLSEEKKPENLFGHPPGVDF